MALTFDHDLVGRKQSAPRSLAAVQNFDFDPAARARFWRIAMPALAFFWVLVIFGIASL